MLHADTGITIAPDLPAEPDIRAEIVALTPTLRNFARRFHRQPDDIEDLVQETLVKALTSLHRFQPGTSLKSWLFTILRNSFCTNYHKRQREPVGFEEVAKCLTTQPAQEWALMHSELRRALKRLPEGSRRALLLVTSGSSYEEAAGLCDCAVGTIKSRVNRARNELETLLM